MVGDDPWDYLRWLPAQLDDDICAWARGALGGSGVIADFEPPPDHRWCSEVSGVRAGRVTIEPYVVLDATGGDSHRRRAAIHAFTRLVGPCFIGEGSTVVGVEIRGSAIGPVCKVRGEVSSSIFLGYGNKGHDGSSGIRASESGRISVRERRRAISRPPTAPVTLTHRPGAGDGNAVSGNTVRRHAKTGIGLRLTTGTILGAATKASLAAMPQARRAFAWGDTPPYGTWEIEKFLSLPSGSWRDAT